MKKIALLLITTSLFLLSGLVFTGCQDPIFEAIRMDVKPETATVSGNIGTITRYTAGGKEFLVLAADGGLKYKYKDNNYHDAWHSLSVPFSLHHYDFDSGTHKGEQIISVLADNTTLYLITAKYSHTSTEGLSYPSSIRLWGKAVPGNGTHLKGEGGEGWTLIVDDDDDIFPISVSDTTNFYYSKFNVFQTNAPQAAHRAAFICAKDGSNYNYYRLNGTTITPVTIDDADIIDSSESSAHVHSVVYFDSGFKFFTCPAATTNETYETEANYYYFTNGGSRLYYSNGTEHGSMGTDDDISALATCSDSLLIGYGDTTYGAPGGIDKADLSSTGKPIGHGSFSTNAQFQITDNYLVLALVNATPEKKETDSALYASITFGGTKYNFNSVGLWSYYKERGNWNRE